jgi:hypothetical protein
VDFAALLEGGLAQSLIADDGVDVFIVISPEHVPALIAKLNAILKEGNTLVPPRVNAVSGSAGKATWPAATGATRS